ncbi:hypothetical protein LJB82_01495 [Desulfovibrio sp. OttesenSCG-928-M16]|nr:hypothetical protein [Desulfovibrio sp. OttesenSCG-928-M16]
MNNKSNNINILHISTDEKTISCITKCDDNRVYLSYTSKFFFKDISGSTFDIKSSVIMIDESELTNLHLSRYDEIASVDGAIIGLEPATDDSIFVLVKTYDLSLQESQFIFGAINTKTSQFEKISTLPHPAYHLNKVNSNILIAWNNSFKMVTFDGGKNWKKLEVNGYAKGVMYANDMYFLHNDRHVTMFRHKDLEQGIARPIIFATLKHEANAFIFNQDGFPFFSIKQDGIPYAISYDESIKIMLMDEIPNKEHYMYIVATGNQGCFYSIYCGQNSPFSSNVRIMMSCNDGVSETNNMTYIPELIFENSSYLFFIGGVAKKSHFFAIQKQ